MNVLPRCLLAVVFALLSTACGQVIRDTDRDAAIDAAPDLSVIDAADEITHYDANLANGDALPTVDALIDASVTVDVGVDAQSEIDSASILDANEAIDANGNDDAWGSSDGSTDAQDPPEIPVLAITGGCSTTDAKDVFVDGAFVYVADGSGGLRIVDVSNPKAPSVIATVNTHDATAVAVQDGYAYVADNEGGLKIVDVSVPEDAEIVASCDIKYAVSVAVTSTHAYVGEYGVTVVDIEDPEKPEVGGTAEAQRMEDLAWDGEYVYGVGPDFDVFNVSNAGKPLVVSSTDVYSWGTGLAVLGDHAYVADLFSGLTVFNIAKPEKPAILGSDSAISPNDVQVAYPYAYVATTSGIEAVDIRDPAAPSVVASQNVAWAYGIAVSGNYAYLANGTEGLTIIRLFDVD